MTRAEQVLEMLAEWKRSTGHGAIAEELIEKYDAENQDKSLPERVRFGKEVHGTLSQLHDAGKIARTKTRTNPASGAEVYEYEIEAIQRGPREKVSKSYKEKYEALLAEIKDERAKKEKQIQWLIDQKNKALAELAEVKGVLARLREDLRIPV